MRRLVLLLCALFATHLLAAPRVIKIGLVTDTGKINDKTFNQTSYEGMMAAAKKYSDANVEIKTSYIETAQPTDFSKNIDLFVNQDYDLVITVGFMLGDATKEAAIKYKNKKTKFIIVDYAYTPKLDNVLGLVFAEDQAGFLAGSLAAQMTKTGVVGIVCGKEIPPVVKFRKGFTSGAQYINKNVKVLGVYIDSFSDPARGKAAALSQIAEKADVIYGAGGPTGSGAIKASIEKGHYGIGVDIDEYYTTFGGKKTPGLLSSTLKRTGSAVSGAIGLFVKGKFAGGIYSGTVANDSIGLAPYHDAPVPEKVKAQMEDIKNKLKKGEIKTGA
ncbi:MAG: BMP family ABC transporter substrate-binding protein [Oligoflexales bacterium]|nr:BMP family ABC transporter substrate-binding protein [Oligoflexales bacterium]